MTDPLLPGISIRLIQQLVARRCDVPVESMTDPDRKRHIAWPRQLAIALAHEFTGHSLTSLGIHFGHRDHSTVFYARQAVESRAEWDPETAEHLAFLRMLLTQMRPKPVELEAAPVSLPA